VVPGDGRAGVRVAAQQGSGVRMGESGGWGVRDLGSAGIGGLCQDEGADTHGWRS